MFKTSLANKVGDFDTENEKMIEEIKNPHTSKWNILKQVNTVHKQEVPHGYIVCYTRSGVPFLEKYFTLTLHNSILGNFFFETRIPDGMDEDEARSMAVSEKRGRPSTAALSHVRVSTEGEEMKPKEEERLSLFASVEQIDEKCDNIPDFEIIELHFIIP